MHSILAPPGWRRPLAVARTPPGSYHAQTRTPTRLGFASIHAAGQCGRTFRVVSEKNVQIASVAEGPRGSL
jgi:hypothetical protein